MTIIKFQTREERAFAELVEEGKQLERQGYFVVNKDDDQMAKQPIPSNVVAFPERDRNLDYLESEMEREEDLELAALVMERQNDLSVVVDPEDLLR
ncbi:MAG: hypothetical protein KKF24_03075 [Gammaproteobacteria bacterium]|nr:hypothetical protein [Gammaproteobacteria bacterium]MBU1831657.1 hypothetical protein [Gammaproteobacteria bacterium]